MPELFLELASEEIPARMQRRAAEDLKRLITNHLVDAGLTYEGAYASATPRRLALGVSGIPARSTDRHEERKGPRVGAPAKAIEGFLRAAGLSSLDEATVASDPKKGDYYLARTLLAGRPAIEIAAGAILTAVKNFPWPVSMRWGPASADPAALRWVRPLSSICATFGPETEDPDIVPVDIPGVPVGDTVRGHRFHAPETFRVRRLADYKSSLERAHVVVDLDRRRDQILHDARDAAFALGLELIEDDRLLEEVAGLVEWPVVLVGRFDERALELPEEVIRLTIRANQKCFVTRDPATGRLANAFVLTANIAASDGGAAIIAGNERVVRARLADARFFWEQDLRVPLAEHAKKLAGVTFHEKLGSQAERVERIAALARELAPLVGADPDLAERAARLAKADLVTGMVGEFPELQGYMGRRYALAAGEPEEVAAAIEEHYAPLGPGDLVPIEAVELTVSLADKIDSLVALWLAGERPTGSGDAYGLRRAALGIIRILLTTKTRFALGSCKPGDILLIALKPFVDRPLLRQWVASFMSSPAADEPVRQSVQRAFEETAIERSSDEKIASAVIAGFLIDRLKVQQGEAGVAADELSAVLRRAEVYDFADIVARRFALHAFLATDDGTNLLAGYRRATNILRDEERREGASITGAPEHNVLTEPAELHLAGAVEVAEVRVREAVAREDYAAAMAELAKLRAPVDAFFDTVRVNADDPRLRLNRLRILAALRDVTREIADFSAISG